MAITSVVTQVLTGSGTYTPTTGMLQVLAVCIGGGGGGAPVTAADDAGGGGGGGGCAVKLFSAADIGANKEYVAGGNYGSMR